MSEKEKKKETKEEEEEEDEEEEEEAEEEDINILHDIHSQIRGNIISRMDICTGFPNA